MELSKLGRRAARAERAPRNGTVTLHTDAGLVIDG
jgi:hypothetical protein